MTDPFLSSDSKFHLESAPTGNDGEHMLEGVAALPRILRDISIPHRGQNRLYIAACGIASAIRRLVAVPRGTRITVMKVAFAHPTNPLRFFSPTKGATIAEWNGAQPYFGVDIAMTSSFATLA
jgi:hypothetical protein